MSAQSIILPSKLNALARKRASERGYGSLDEYVQALIQEDSPAPISDEIEAHLLKSLRSTPRQASRDFWAKKRRELKRVHRPHTAA
jgi:hypothetical protein